jgi:glycosyltransferase involved in cell wall biosynthesis
MKASLTNRPPQRISESNTPILRVGSTHLPAQSREIRPEFAFARSQAVEWLTCKMGENVFMQRDTWLVSRGALFLAYSFGLALIGSVTENIIEGRTGFVCRPRDPVSVARAVTKYFESNLFEHLEELRSDIREVANDRYSWEKMVEITKQVYGELLGS